ncbi:hypothetical protein H072_7923 [Dactylellina haptotyla CBS 200.50]|uniref:Bola-like protein n=1 Tax=Dactylellina haptotyla (strain CBS 200.50) TaxID=1284197 RepID=S8AB23_DACHA|nr:hypothetical protein H072_7923 [Dactylellina haptotyla CBS 200.50]
MASYWKQITSLSLPGLRRACSPAAFPGRHPVRFSAPTWRRPYSTATEPPTHLDEKEAGIFLKLSGKLNPSRLEVRDISGGCGSMYAVEIESPLFRGLTTLKMHRQVQDVLADDIKGWHGIQLKTKATPADE